MKTAIIIITVVVVLFLLVYSQIHEYQNNMHKMSEQTVLQMFEGNQSHISKSSGILITNKGRQQLQSIEINPSEVILLSKNGQKVLFQHRFRRDNVVNRAFFDQMQELWQRTKLILTGGCQKYHLLTQYYEKFVNLITTSQMRIFELLASTMDETTINKRAQYTLLCLKVISNMFNSIMSPPNMVQGQSQICMASFVLLLYVFNMSVKCIKEIETDRVKNTVYRLYLLQQLCDMVNKYGLSTSNDIFYDKEFNEDLKHMNYKQIELFDYRQFKSFERRLNFLIEKSISMTTYKSRNGTMFQHYLAFVKDSKMLSVDYDRRLNDISYWKEQIKTYQELNRKQQWTTLTFPAQTIRLTNDVLNMIKGGSNDQIGARIIQDRNETESRKSQKTEDGIQPAIGGYKVTQVNYDKNNEYTLIQICGGAFLFQCNFVYKNFYKSIENYNIFQLQHESLIFATDLELIDQIFQGYMYIMNNFAIKKVILLGDSSGGFLSVQLLTVLNQLQKQSQFTNITIPNKCVLLQPLLDIADHRCPYSVLYSMKKQSLRYSLASVALQLKKCNNISSYFKSPMQVPEDIMKQIFQHTQMTFVLGTQDTLYHQQICFIRHFKKCFEEVKATTQIIEVPHSHHGVWAYDIFFIRYEPSKKFNSEILRPQLEV